ncbi:ParB/RepB/Spo0J family partition protein [Sphaerimonospora mesophila]|uniref:ParB/RepB/Spo0J family partition protein n=1 Tax=Sphaerimonospora mesophila TaxID=37483 RepID=UPI0006E26C08
MSTTTVAEWETDLREAEGLRLVRIPLKFLDHHPDNVRSDFALTGAFCQSLAAEQQVPVHVIPIPADHQRAEGEEDHRFWVTKGNRRLAAARSTQLPDLLCLIDLAKAGDRAGQFIDMVVENDDEFRHGLTAFEQAQALFEAHQAGANRTRLQKATGRNRRQISEALTAGGLSATTRQAARQMDYEWTLEDLALLAEFDGDEEGLAEIHERLRWGGKVRYVVERVRTERAEAAEQARLRAELEQAGITVTEQLPPGALTLARLIDAVDGFDPDTHTTCGGHGVYFRSFDKTTPVAYCTTPDQHGHAAPIPPVEAGTTEPEPGKADDLERRLVIEGNRAWKASAVVRQEWVTALLARSTAPKPVLAWVARQLVEMPNPLRDKLTAARHSTLWATLTGNFSVDSAVTVRPGRLPLLALAPIVVAYEHQLTVPDTARYTWRQDRSGPVSRADAAAYLSLLAELGYLPTPIEQAIIDGVPYRGDAPTGEGLESDPSADDTDVNDRSQHPDEAETNGGTSAGEKPEPDPSAEAADVDSWPQNPAAAQPSGAPATDVDAWVDPETDRDADADADDGTPYSAAA